MRLALPLVLLAPLAGCISFGDKPPPTLMNLHAEQGVSVGTTRPIDDASIAVLVPTVPQEVAGQRVPVTTSDTSVAYLKDALWVEPPNRLFRNLLAEVIAARTGRMVPDPRNFAAVPDTRLGGRLLAFGLDAGTTQVVVTYDAALVRKGGKIATRRFEARIPATAETGPAVAQALNRAANQVAVEVADWISQGG